MNTIILEVPRVRVHVSQIIKTQVYEKGVGRTGDMPRHTFVHFIQFMEKMAKIIVWDPSFGKFWIHHLLPHNLLDPTSVDMSNQYAQHGLI